MPLVVQSAFVYSMIQFVVIIIKHINHISQLEIISFNIKKINYLFEVFWG